MESSASSRGSQERGEEPQAGWEMVKNQFPGSHGHLRSFCSFRGLGMWGANSRASIPSTRPSWGLASPTGRSQPRNSLPSNSHWDEPKRVMGVLGSAGIGMDGGETSQLQHPLPAHPDTDSPKSLFLPFYPTLNLSHVWEAIRTWKIPSPA